MWKKLSEEVPSKASVALYDGEDFYKLVRLSNGEIFATEYGDYMTAFNFIITQYDYDEWWWCELPV